MHVGCIPIGFWDSVSMRAAEPEIVYFGAMPQVPKVYYPLAHLTPTLWRGASAFVYLLLACDGSVLYAGKAREPGNRFDKHRRKHWWDEVALLLLIRVMGTNQSEADTVALHVESLAIKQLDPIYNVAGARRRPNMPRGVFI